MSNAPKFIVLVQSANYHYFYSILRGYPRTSVKYITNPDQLRGLDVSHCIVVTANGMRYIEDDADFAERTRLIDYAAELDSRRQSLIS